MSRLLLKTDSEREIVLEAPRTAAWVSAAVLGGVAIAVRLLLPGLWIAPAMLGLFSLVILSQALQVHRLNLDIERGVYVYRRGFIQASPRRRGSLDEVAGVIIERNELGDGLAVSRLRSRLVTLEIEGWPEGEGRFVLGFPMGPRVAEDKAADYAQRLGTEVVDRATPGDEANAVEEPEGDL